jgi:hypothetical protein
MNSREPGVTTCEGDVRSGALFVGEEYRYRCWRHWGETPGSNPLVFLMLNPSTADAVKLDPTLRKCRGFAERWGHDGMEILNLFAWRATDPRDLERAAKAGHNIVGMFNDVTIETVVQGRRLVVACGAHAFAKDRLRQVVQGGYLKGAKETLALKVTKDGMPGHPLYIPYETEPKPWQLP